MIKPIPIFLFAFAAYAVCFPRGYVAPGPVSVLHLVYQRMKGASEPVVRKRGKLKPLYKTPLRLVENLDRVALKPRPRRP